jgi:small-conductance mechanosensitive channel
LSRFVNSFRKLAIFLIAVTFLSVSIIYLYDLVIELAISLPMFMRQVFRISLILGFWSIVLLALQQAKPYMAKRIGNQAAAVTQIILGIISIIIMSFGILQTLGVAPQTLLTGAGFASLTMGLIVSTFVGSLLSGALVFSTHRYRIDDTVVVNNVPGEVVDITALATIIETDVGQMSIPNSAIASGSVIITTIRKHKGTSGSRLPYIQGDRVITNYANEEGTVEEITPLRTVILLDSGKQLTFLNNSVVTGTVAIAKVKPKSSVQAKKKAAE